jgi:hypothetical protein
MAGRQREAWNDEDDATLARLAAAGEPASAIARALERTQEAVRARARRRKIQIRA